MYCVKKMTEDLYWVGASERRLNLFENAYPLTNGVSYNSYLLLDEKTVLIDTVDKSVSGLYFENVEHVLSGRKLDYLIVQHMEPDHAATIGELVLRHPEVTVVCNAKTRRVSVCNALDCLLVDGDRMKDLPALCAPLQESNVIIYADTLAYASLQGHYPAELLKEATEEDFGTEFLDYKLAVKVVEGIDSAIAHIQQYGSKHSECIVTEDKEHANWFCREVDAACVYVNAPTSFTDGAQFGLGAEIGISTQKLHARGPMALEEITTYKWIIEGEGQIRK